MNFTLRKSAPQMRRVSDIFLSICVCSLSGAFIITVKVDCFVPCPPAIAACRDFHSKEQKRAHHPGLLAQTVGSFLLHSMWSLPLPSVVQPGFKISHLSLVVKCPVEFPTFLVDKFPSTRIPFSSICGIMKTTCGAKCRR